MFSPGFLKIVIYMQKVFSEWVHFFFQLIRGERIQIPLSAGHHWPASETPFKSPSDGGPTLNAGL